MLIDRFLEDATEVDVDALARYQRRRADRRHHGAHRRSRRALGRFELRAAVDIACAGNARDDPRLHRASWRAR